MHTLYICEGETFKQATPAVILEVASCLMQQAFEPELPQKTDELRAFLRLKLGRLEYEVFALVFLDEKHEITDYLEVFRGTVDSVANYPREVVREAVRRRAAAVILVHNHPSGKPEPSMADRLVTRRLKDALGLIDIEVLDHLIVGEQGQVVSFADRGLIEASRGSNGAEERAGAVSIEVAAL